MNLNDQKTTSDDAKLEWVPQLRGWTEVEMPLAIGSGKSWSHVGPELARERFLLQD